MKKHEVGGLFPKVEPYHSGGLDVGDGHEIYFEECGKRKGFPIIFFHGGPGAGCEKSHRRFFNPRKWRIILFDQRGSGRSRPQGGIVNNTTDHLVADAIKLVKHLKVRKAVFFGGSWGSTLALVCAIKHPELVAGMILRGIFLGTEQEIKEYSVGCAGNYFPELRARFVSRVPTEKRDNIVKYYYQKIAFGADEEKKIFAYEWARYEDAMLSLKPKADEVIDKELKKYPFESYALVNTYYMRNGCFLEDDFIIKNAGSIPDVPIVMVQGRYDMLCAPANAARLKEALPKAKLYMTLAGHSGSDRETRKRLISETELMFGKVNDT